MDEHSNMSLNDETLKLNSSDVPSDIETAKREEAKNCAKLLQAIAESNRIRIIECLWNGPQNVTELHKMLNVAIVNVSHHLGVLRNAGLVEDRKQGRFVMYSLSPKYFRVASGAPKSLDLGWCQMTVPQL
jgi:ArsR family transcriptional regulator, nickel/cobalt-responsive transcriptional repressor